MRHPFLYACSGLSLLVALSGCNTPPPPALPKPAPVIKVQTPPEPQPFENGVISVPVSPVHSVPSDW